MADASASARHPAVAYAVAGVVAILGSAVCRLTPLAVLPLLRLDLTVLEWLEYLASVLLFGYVEGYKAFQLKFSPMCVQRALTLSSPHRVCLHRALAPFYAIGLLHASRRRLITSWSISLLVAMLVILVRSLPYPQRSMVDAGVVTGLSWGAAAIVVYYVRALAGHGAPGVDPQLPEPCAEDAPYGRGRGVPTTRRAAAEGEIAVAEPLKRAGADLELSGADEMMQPEVTPSTCETIGVCVLAP